MRKVAASSLAQAAREATKRLAERERLGLATPQRSPSKWVGFQESLREPSGAYDKYRRKLQKKAPPTFPHRRGSPAVSNNLIKSAAYIDELQKIALEKQALTPGLTLKMLQSPNRLVRGAGNLSARAMGAAPLGQELAQNMITIGGEFGPRIGMGYNAGYLAGRGLHGAAARVSPYVPQSAKRAWGSWLTNQERGAVKALVSPEGIGSATSLLF